MATYSFKSVGRTASTQLAEAPAESPIPIGIKTPLRLGSGEGIWGMHYDMVDVVHDNLRNLILTNWGERLGVYDYGANLKELTTELVSVDDFESEAIVRIKDAVGRWMPYVVLQNFVGKTEHEGNQKIGIISFQVTYDVPVLQVQNKALEISMYVI
jgi:phage baseplate assembly protein W